MGYEVRNVIPNSVATRVILTLERSDRGRIQ